MKNIYFLAFAVLTLFAGWRAFSGHADGMAGQVLLVSNSPDNKVAATVSREGEDNSRDAIYHIYLAPAEAGTPDEVVTITNSSQAYVHWESDAEMLIVFNGGSAHYAHGTGPVIVQNGSEKRSVVIGITNDLRRRS